MQATIANGSRTKAPHEMAMNRAALNSAIATPGVGFSSVESSRRIRSQTPLAECSSYGLSADANQQLYADLTYAAYTYGQTSTSRSLQWPTNQSAYSDDSNGAGYGYDQDPPAGAWSKTEQSYAEHVQPTYGYEQARNYIFPQDSSYPKYPMAGQETLQPRNNSVSTTVHPYGNGYRSWSSTGNVFSSRESSVVHPGLYQSQDSAYYTERDTKIEKSLSPPSSQLFLPESSDFFLDYTDVGAASDSSSLNGPLKTDEAVHGINEQVGILDSELEHEYFSIKEESTAVVSPKDLPEPKRLKIDTDLLAYPQNDSSSSPTELTSSASSVSPVHRNGKKFPCGFCAKVFNRPSSRNTHELVHTGEKPHMCTFPTCGKRFSVLSNLRRHLKIHRAPPKGRGRHAHSSSSSSDNSNNNITNTIINGNNINSINSNNGNYLHQLGASSPHPYRGLEYYY